MAVGIILLFIGMIVIPANAEQVKNNPLTSFNGRTLYVGGSGPGNYSHIQDAIDDASAGDTVFVFDDSSPYTEHIIVNKAINLIGENKWTTVINSTGSNYIIEIKANRVSLSNFTIDADHKSQSSSLRLLSNNNVISDNIFQKTWLGISVFTSRNNDITNNIFRDLRSGIELVFSTHNRISNNALSNPGGAGVGIYLSYSRRNMIEGNNIAGFFCCIQAKNVNLFNKIINNNLNCSDSRYGISMYWLNIPIPYMPYIISVTISEISGNTIMNASNGDGAAIYITGGTHDIHNNIIKNCSLLFKLEGGSIIVRQNTFLNYQEDVYFFVSLFSAMTTFWFRNYWNETLLTPKPITGQIIIFPFYPLVFHSWTKYDWFPAQKPYDIQ